MLRWLSTAFLFLLSTELAWTQALSVRDMFFSDYVLYSAQADVNRMRLSELEAFRDVLAECVDDLNDNEFAQHGCNVQRTRYLIEFRQERPIDALLESARVMSTLSRRNRAIGRESEPGLASRLAAVHAGLASAARLAFRQAAEPTGPEFTRTLAP